MNKIIKISTRQSRCSSRLLRVAVTLVVASSLMAACKQMPSLPNIPTIVSPYRIDIQQGNLITQEMLAKLKPGMTRSQVKFALGSPPIVDPFRNDRWDYVYVYVKQGKQPERRTITVIFDDDKLLRIEGDVASVPSGARPVIPMPPERVDAKPAPAKPVPQASPTPQPDAGAAK